MLVKASNVSLWLCEIAHNNNNNNVVFQSEYAAFHLRRRLQGALRITNATTVNVTIEFTPAMKDLKAPLGFELKITRPRDDAKFCLMQCVDCVVRFVAQIRSRELVRRRSDQRQRMCACLITTTKTNKTLCHGFVQTYFSNDPTNVPEGLSGPRRTVAHQRQLRERAAGRGLEVRMTTTTTTND